MEREKTVNCFECKHREVIRMLVGEEIAETDLIVTKKPENGGKNESV